MRTIGVTGGIAGGKTSVTQILEERWPVLDADLVSREVVAPGQEGLSLIVEAFGDEVLSEDGTLNRAALRHIIAHSKEAQQRLNAILHPLIVNTIKQRLVALAEAGHKLAFVSAALMIESGSYKNYDDLILVTAPAPMRLRRLLKRDGMTEEAARNLMDKQMNEDQKRVYASAIIINDGNLEVLRKRTERVLDQLNLV